MRGVIFDFNGTMFLDEDKHIESWKKFALDEFSFDLKDEDFDKHVHGKNNADILSYLTDRKLSKEEVFNYAKKKELMYQKLCEQDKKNLHLVDGLEDFLFSLKERGIKLAIATASMKPNVDWYIKTFELLRFFDEKNIIYDNGNLERGKPDPLIYQITFKTLGIEKEEAVIFEDSFSGLTSAVASKARYVVAISPTGETRQNVKGVSYTIKDFTKMPSEIEVFLSK